MISNTSDVVNKTLVSRRLSHSWDLIRGLVSRDMKVRYKRSFVGTAWTILNPLAQLAVLYFIFTYVLPTSIPNFVAFLLIGILVWSWFSTALSTGTGAIVDNAVLIRRPGFSISVLPVVSVTTQLVHFLFALPILVIVLLIDGFKLTPELVALPLIVGIQFILILSLVFWLSTIHVSFRDTKYLLDIFLILGFYLSPVFYSPEAIPEKFQWLYNLNPMVHIIGAYRSILLAGEFPPPLPLVVVAMVSVITLLLGYNLFKSTSYRFVEEI